MSNEIPGGASAPPSGSAMRRAIDIIHATGIPGSPAWLVAEEVIRLRGCLSEIAEMTEQEAEFNAIPMAKDALSPNEQLTARVSGKDSDV